MDKRHYTDEFKDFFNSLSEEPPSDVEEGIFNHLAQEKAKKRKKRNKKIYWGAFTSLMIAVSLSGGYYFSSNENDSLAVNPGTKESVLTYLAPNQNFDFVSPQEQEGNSLFKDFELVKSLGDKESLRKEPGSDTGFSESSVEESTSAATLRAAINGSEEANEEPLEQLARVESPSVPISDLHPDPVMASSEVSEPEFEGDYYPERNSPLAFGAILKGKQGRLLDNKAYESFESSSLVETNAGMSVDFGVFARYKVDKDQSLRSELMLSDRNSQTYKEYVEGNRISRETSLRYSRLSLLYQRTSPLSQGMSSNGLDLMAGVYYGYLWSAVSTTQGDEQESIKEEFSDHDLGLELGVQYHYALSSHLNLFGSLRGTTSLTNIYQGTEKVPGSFNKTRNLTWGLNVGIEYELGDR